MGSLEAVGDNGGAITVRGVRLQALLAALALRCGTTVPVDRLVDNVWGDTPPAGSTNALQRHVSGHGRRRPGPTRRVSLSRAAPRESFSRQRGIGKRHRVGPTSTGVGSPGAYALRRDQLPR
jgi:hypothetical protein